MRKAKGGARGNASGAVEINDKFWRAGRARKQPAPKKTNNECESGGKPVARDNQSLTAGGAGQASHSVGRWRGGMQWYEYS